VLDALTLEKSKQVVTTVVTQFGKIETLESPRLTTPNQAVTLAHGALSDLEITVALDEQNRIASLWFQPSKKTIPVPDKLTTSFHLPFEDKWLVGCADESLHHASPLERFALDFVVVDETGCSHQGEGKENTDYYAFGMPVLAPADGVVTDVVTGIRDNSPGSINPSCAIGNAVFLMHQEHEVSVLAHLQQGSIRVKCGERVKQGQVLGFCGNSGYSFQPHIHFQVQNTPVMQDATGLRCVFEKITVTIDGKGESRTSHAPVKGDIVGEE
jgi:hypothetical protein